MARSSIKDPLDKFRYSVVIDGFIRAGFSSCETPSFSLNTQKYAEGGNHLWPKNIIDSIDYKPIALQRGVTSNMDFNDWATQFFDVTRQQAESELVIDEKTQLPTRKFISHKEQTNYRKDIIIEHRDRAGRVIKSYKLYNAFPIEFKPASDFSADGDDLISMERLVLSYEAFEVFTPTEDTNPISPNDLIKRLINRAF